MLSQSSFWIATWPLKAKGHCHDAPTESCVDCTTAPEPTAYGVLRMYCICGMFAMVLEMVSLPSNGEMGCKRRLPRLRSVSEG